MDDALKIMEEGQKVPNRPAPALPPRVLGNQYGSVDYWSSHWNMQYTSTRITTVIYVYPLLFSSCFFIF